MVNGVQVCYWDVVMVPRQDTELVCHLSAVGCQPSGTGFYALWHCSTGTVALGTVDTGKWRCVWDSSWFYNEEKTARSGICRVVIKGLPSLRAAHVWKWVEVYPCISVFYVRVKRLNIWKLAQAAALTEFRWYDRNPAELWRWFAFN